MLYEVITLIFDLLLCQLLALLIHLLELALELLQLTLSALQALIMVQLGVALLPQAGHRQLIPREPLKQHCQHPPPGTLARLGPGGQPRLGAGTAGLPLAGQPAEPLAQQRLATLQFVPALSQLGLPGLGLGQHLLALLQLLLEELPLPAQALHSYNFV